MRIREFTMADHDAVQALWGTAEFLHPTTRADLERAAAHAPDLFLVGEVDGAIVATVLGSDDGRRGWLFRVAVHPDHRRGGLGRAMVAEVEQRLRARGLDKLRLLVLAENDPGQAFWAALGYERAAPIVMYGKDLTGGSDTAC